MSDPIEDRISIQRFHSEMPERVRSKARRVLRRKIAENPDYKTSRLDAEVVIEQVWNALVGNDKIKFNTKPRRGRVWRNKKSRARSALEASHA